VPCVPQCEFVYLQCMDTIFQGFVDFPLDQNDMVETLTQYVLPLSYHAFILRYFYT
jgi:hypothetical protein